MDLSLWTMAATLAGGLGLFLLGMTMMTDGLKLAAGPVLERILAAATRTRWHALGSGVLVTAVVQSSTAVTVAAIGFVNAGLMTLAPALWVLFGANVGTTMTGWVVALIGLELDVEALAMPLIGVGVVLRLSGREGRRAAVSDAMAGFGLLFLGIALLQDAFGGLSGLVDLPTGTGPMAVFAQVLGGIVLTLLTQSSSASMAIALTAAQSGLLTAQAAAHVVFNVLTGAVALALLPWLVQGIADMRQAMVLVPDPAIWLALFHSVFNVLGVLLMWPLMWPLAGALTRWLQQRFRAAEEDEAQLARALRVQRYHQTAAEEAVAAARLPAVPPPDTPAAEAAASFTQAAAALLALCDPLPEAGAVPPGAAALDAGLAPMLDAYQALKAAVLDAGAIGAMRMQAMEAALRRHSAWRRAVEQAVKAARLTRMTVHDGLPPGLGAAD